MQSIEDLLKELAPHILDGAQIFDDRVMVRCPFHGGGQERTPSCAVSRRKPVFFCHGCSASGHISKFLRGVSVPVDIARRVTERVKYDYEDDPGGSGKHSIFSGANPFRGKFVLDDEILDEWRLCPQGLKQAGFREKTLRHFEVGVDEAMQRVTFPIRNLYGELVGVSGRTLIKDLEPRYKIYSAKDLARFSVSPDYSMASIKGAVLWHAHLVFPIAFRDSSPIIVVEGFKAAMWVWQAGFHNVVALIGAHLTKLQLEILARTGSEVLLFLDNNAAGHKGTHAAAKILVKKNIVKVMEYPDLRQQPDQLDVVEINVAVGTSISYVMWKLKHKETTT